MFRKVKAAVEGVRNRILAVKREAEARVSAVKERVNGFLLAVFPPKYRRVIYTVCWFAGRFVYEFFSILAGWARRFADFLSRIATYWQTFFLTREYGEFFVRSSLKSIIFAWAFSAPEFLIIIILLIFIPFIFAVLCAGAAQAVLEFIYLFFKYMPPIIWMLVVAVPLTYVAFLAYIRTNLAWREKNGLFSLNFPAEMRTRKISSAVRR